MPNEQIIKKLIRDSLQRAVQESLAAGIVLLIFTTILYFSPPRSPAWYGSLAILVATLFVVGVVWTYALNTKLLESHAADDVAYWHSVFSSQAKLLRMVPFWYTAPLSAGAILFALPTSTTDLVPFLLVAGAVLAVIIWTTRLNRAEAERLEASGRQLI